MVKVTICIGSSCHLKGSRLIVETLQRLVAEQGLKDRVELAGQFCMGNCQNGVCVSIGDQPYSLLPEDTAAFFTEHVLPLVKD
jgi:NADH:ubiquinone oxidoreductase subunit E